MAVHRRLCSFHKGKSHGDAPDCESRGCGSGRVLYIAGGVESFLPSVVFFIMDENDTINMIYSCRVRLVMMCKERGTLSAGMPKKH